MRIDYITHRDVANAGDNLIGHTLQRLFDLLSGNPVEYKVHAVHADDYAGIAAESGRVLFGPGGIVTGSMHEGEGDRMFLRGINNDVLKEWRQRKTKVVFFGSGTNAAEGYRDFTEKSGALLRETVSVSSALYLRGDADIAKIGSYLLNETDKKKLRFQPCPSIFLDRIYDIAPAKEDRVAVNLSFRGLSREETEAHPIKRFNEFARANGLTPVCFGNHPADVNRHLVRLFGEHIIYNSPRYTEDTIQGEKEANKNRKGFSNRMHRDKRLARDFNGFRFSFGRRLHGYLPFASFGTIPVFLTDRPVRKGIPRQYFCSDEYLLPYRPEQANECVDQMIDRLALIMKNEDRLVAEMAEHRDRLWHLTKTNVAEALELLDAPRPNLSAQFVSAVRRAKRVVRKITQHRA